MTDLHAQFRALDLVQTPDLWDEIARRAEEPVATVSVRRVEVARTTFPGIRTASPSRQVALLLVLAALLGAATIATALVAGALRNQPAPVVRPSPAVAPSPSVLPENGLIAVSANPTDVSGGEVGDIYLVGEGAPARRIIGSTGDGIAQECPQFSPDGRNLAYGEARASDPVTTFRGVWPVTDRAVVVVGVDDHGDASPPKMRVTVPGSGPMICPRWSPSGAQVAFQVGSELWISAVATGQTTVAPIGPGSGFQQNELEWSHDGSRIAVAEPGRIRIVHVADGGSTLISVGGVTAGSLGWTAGDDRIIYVTPDGPGYGGAVHVVDAHGKNETQLTPHDPELWYGDSPVSPDGTRVAFVQHQTRCASDGSCTQDPPELMVMGTDGTNVVQLPIPSTIGLDRLHWSPDGKRLLLSSIDGVFSVGLTPGSPVVVHSSGELNLEWSPSEVTWQPVFPVTGAPTASEEPVASASTNPVAVMGDQAGTIAVTVGAHGLGSGVSCQALGDGGLSVHSGLVDGDEVALVFRLDGTVSSLSGSMRGVAWKVTQNPQGTLRADRSGSFHGTDSVSGADVSVTFACK